LISWLLETIASFALGLVNFMFMLRDETARSCHDDPYTAERKELVRCWLLSFAAAVIVSVLAVFLGSALNPASAGGQFAFAAETLRQGLFYVVAAALSLSLLCMTYFGYRVWRLERSR
jgi:hypothetical protein